MATLNTPDYNCPLCPRLAKFRNANATKFPDFHNGPVPSFGGVDGRLLIVGLAPGLKGANRTARPFTGDYAGDLLFPTLKKFGFSRGTYNADPKDGVELIDCRITNAVRCVPPQNKPIGAEVAACRPFFEFEFEMMPNLQIVLALGGLAHKATLATLGYTQSAFKFAHAAAHDIKAEERPLTLINSYHCSRYNTNTGRLTTEMFEDVFTVLREHLN
ncbi:MAG: uracil-DNA glycosylase [Alphaproteobacteria bacterium]|nr:uracil-DNA glycosylase [Alphaproteobacteria bacterium]